MAIVEELIRKEADGVISFGNHKLEQKAKVDEYECDGDVYKVKTYKTMTKLERNGMFVYESVPGTSVLNYKETADAVTFTVEGDEDAQITVGLAENTEYDVVIGSEDCGKMKTNLGGKMNISVELAGVGEVSVKIAK